MPDREVRRKRQIRVDTEIAVNPCTLLESAANAAVTRAEAEIPGSTLESMSAILLATFAVEAYLNHLAEEIRSRDSAARELRSSGLEAETILAVLGQDVPELTLPMLQANLAKQPMAELWAGERTMKFLEKLQVLMAWLDLPYDKGRDPTIQHLIRMSRLRSSLVHGKTRRATSTITRLIAEEDPRTNFDLADERLDPAWRRLSTPRVARSSVDAGREIRTRLSMAAGYGRYHFGLGYLGAVNVGPAD